MPMSRRHVETGEMRPFQTMPGNPQGAPAAVRGFQRAAQGYYPNVNGATQNSNGAGVAGSAIPPRPYTPLSQITSYTNPETWGDGKIRRDRHPWLYVGSENSGRLSGFKDPQEDGPARPSMAMMNRTWYPWIGYGAQNFYDPARGYSPYGQQDGVSWTQVRDENPEGGGTCVVRVPPSGPHGLHTKSVQNIKVQTERGYRERPQQTPGRVSRLSNSRVSGASFSAQTLHQGGGRV